MLSTSILCAQEKSHSLFLGGGYGISFKDGQTDDLIGRLESLKADGSLAFEDASPKLAEGLHVLLGYRLDFKPNWYWSSELAYLHGVSWRRKRYEGSEPFFEWYSTQAESWWFRNSVNFCLGKQEDFNRNQFFKNVYVAVGVGPSVFKTRIRHEQITPENSLSLNPSELVYYSVRGLGVGGFGDVQLAIPVSEAMEFSLVSRLELAQYYNYWIKWEKLMDANGDVLQRRESFDPFFSHYSKHERVLYSFSNLTFLAKLTVNFQ